MDIESKQKELMQKFDALLLSTPFSWCWKISGWWQPLREGL